MHQPPLHILPIDLLPPVTKCVRDQVGGGEPLHRLGVGPYRPGSLALGCQVQPERADLRLEHPGFKRLARPRSRLRVGHGFSLFLRFR
jgi:hypothetical protein